MITRNILFIMSDQQHFRTLGCHGVPEARTPKIDRLAAGGLDFHAHFVTNPVCSPSRASIMTGRYITEHGLWTNGCALPTEVPTLPQVMGQRGFQTAHFGKLHLVPILTRVDPHPAYGFGVCEVAEGDQQLTHDAYFAWLRRNDPELFVRFLTELYEKGHDCGYKSLMPEEKHQTTWTTRRAIDWLRHGRSGDRPFLLSVGYFDPHHAFNPCEPYASMYDDIPVTMPAFEPGAIESKPPHYRTLFNGISGTTRNPNRMTAILKAYHAMCAHVDKAVGDLLAALCELGLDRDTAVIFTSDHGELAGNHGLLWKGPYMLDDLLRVPLVIAIPGQPGTPRKVRSLTSSIDLMATIQRLAGVEQPEDASGQPFLDNALKVEVSRQHVLAEWEAPRTGMTGSIRCVRTKSAKLVEYAQHPHEGELYDLSADPTELLNLYHEPRFDEMRRSLSRLIAEQQRPRPQVPYEGGW
jgi:arylsulfatase